MYGLLCCTPVSILSPMYFWITEIMELSCVWHEILSLEFQHKSCFYRMSIDEQLFLFQRQENPDAAYVYNTY